MSCAVWAVRPFMLLYTASNGTALSRALNLEVVAIPVAVKGESPQPYMRDCMFHSVYPCHVMFRNSVVSLISNRRE